MEDPSKLNATMGTKDLELMFMRKTLVVLKKFPETLKAQNLIHLGLADVDTTDISTTMEEACLKMDENTFKLTIDRFWRGSD